MKAREQLAHFCRNLAVLLTAQQTVANLNKLTGYIIEQTWTCCYTSLCCTTASTYILLRETLEKTFRAVRSSCKHSNCSGVST